MGEIAFLFPGQGSQYVGMGKSFADDFALARRRFEEAGDALGFDLRKLCLEGSMSELTQTMNAQPAILAVSVIAHDLLRQEVGVEADYLAGHSLGEYTALVCSGVMSYADALKIVRRRGEIMQQADPQQVGAMAAVFHVEGTRLEALCEAVSTPSEPVVIACRNSHTQYVISGHRNAVQKVIDELGAATTKHTFLKVSAPFHSPMMGEAAEELVAELSRYTYGSMQRPVICNVTGMPYESDHQMISRLKEHMTMPVRWTETMLYLEQQGVTDYVELGPKKSLSDLVKQTLPGAATYPLGQTGALSQVKVLGERVQSKRQDIRRQLETCWVTAVITRNRNRETAEYNRRVTPLFQQLKTLSEQQEAPASYVQTSVALLESVLAVKQVPQAEQASIIRRITGV